MCFCNICILNFASFIIHVSVLQKTLRAGKLTEKILKLFIATGKEEVHSLIQALNIKHVLTPVLPTSKSLTIPNYIPIQFEELTYNSFDRML